MKPVAQSTPISQMKANPNQKKNPSLSLLPEETCWGEELEEKKKKQAEEEMIKPQVESSNPNPPIIIQTEPEEQNGEQNSEEQQDERMNNPYFREGRTPRRNFFMKKSPFQSPKHINKRNPAAALANSQPPQQSDNQNYLTPFSKKNQNQNQTQNPKQQPKEEKEKEKEKQQSQQKVEKKVEKSSVTIKDDTFQGTQFSWENFQMNSEIPDAEKQKAKNDSTSDSPNPNPKSTKNSKITAPKPQSTNMVKSLLSYKNDDKSSPLKSVVLQPRGLSNISNSCYMNAVMQALIFMPDFYNLVRSIGKRIIQFKIDENKSKNFFF